VWFFVPYNLLWFYGLDAWGRHRMGVYLAVINAAAFWSGGDPQLQILFTLLGIFGHLLSEKRDSLLRGVLQQVLAQREQLEKAHRELRQMHERALEQEKLSSLGVLAAGLAHEINNPMSFVTSNVNSLLRDLRRQAGLPEELREYVDEVLPATLEGIQRVNATVADLRRFAQGDPGADAEYDLNDELKAALRVVHGQLSHCRVKVELGEVGRLVGRSRQIVQVLVNVLANAGQATAAGGRVSISTRREGEWARVDIRDEGEGMSEETKRQLFQPFFTTRPQKRRGTGLAVAHGIVTAHGGRIEVESELGKGTCVSLFLPRAPPPSRVSLSMGLPAVGSTRRGE
jgi:signal transduction histidine kinase